MDLYGSNAKGVTELDLAEIGKGLRESLLGSCVSVSGLAFSSGTGLWGPPYVFMGSGISADIDDRSTEPSVDLFARADALGIGYMQYREITVTVEELAARGITMRRSFRLGTGSPVAPTAIYEVQDFADDTTQAISLLMYCRKL